MGISSWIHQIKYGKCKIAHRIESRHSVSEKYLKFSFPDNRLLNNLKSLMTCEEVL